MSTKFARVVFSLLLVCLVACPVAAQIIHPLEPPNTESPRATLMSFLMATEQLSSALRANPVLKDEARDAWERAMGCFDLSEVPPTLRENVALESVLLLREIFDRMELPAMEDVPDVYEVRKNEVTFWEFPHTEIAVALVDKGLSRDFLFTPATVSELNEYYEQVRHLPYLNESGDNGQGIYEEFVYASGWMIPDGLIGRLPNWCHEPVLGQAAWKWIGLSFVFCVSTIFMVIFIRWHNHWRANRKGTGYRLSRLVLPLTGIGMCVMLEYMVKIQVNITGKVLSVVSMGLEGFMFLFSAWGILVLGSVATHAIISSRHLSEEALDADVIKLICRLVSLGLVLLLFFKAGAYLGIPVTAIFASAGLVGIAVALAARETLANFFGGVSIFMDRPFRAGDFIVLDSGKRGEVKAVGMRSTRILTRDRVLITIPNSMITNSKVVNQSAPTPQLRVRASVSVAYDSDVEQVEALLFDIAQKCDALLDDPAPKVRIDGFEDSGIRFLVLGIVPSARRRREAISTLHKEILRRFKEERITIPYPVRSVLVRNME